MVNYALSNFQLVHKLFRLVAAEQNPGYSVACADRVLAEQPNPVSVLLLTNQSGVLKGGR